MNIKHQIQSLINEAAVYDTQGLYEESKEKYIRAAQAITQHAHIVENHKTLLNSVSKRIKRLEKTLERMENEPVAYQMPNIVLDVMKRNFSSSRDKDQAALEGALALVAFQQYESALEEFTKLLKVQSTRLEATKNIIRCHLAKGRTAETVNLFLHWRNSGLMGPDEMIELRRFFQHLSDSRQLGLELPDAEIKKPEMGRAAGRSSGLHTQAMDFSSICLRFPDGPRKKLLREFEINAQSENVVTVLIPVHEKEIAEGLKKGTVLDPVQCFSTNAMYSGKATVIEHLPVLSGDNAGSFRIDIKILGI